jgi:rod shape-determining protein MreD
MNGLNSIAILGVAFLAVFAEVTLDFPERLLGSRIDLLPALIVYAGLSTRVATLSLVTVLGGLWFDSFSANPLGISVLPLAVVGFLIEKKRELIMRDEVWVQFLLGLTASLFVPAMTLLMLINLGKEPLLNWDLLRKWLTMGLSGGILTPLLFRVFYLWNRTFAYPAISESSFRLDRQIKRGPF